MYGLPQPVMPNVHWNRHRPPHNPQWRPFHGPRARVPHFRPRNHGFYNPRPQVESGSEEHWCETCDRGFHTEDLLSKHKQEHQKCNIDGCQFIAHPKVITKHIQMQHSSGLYKKIAKLKNPEEIEKWREERKKKYPTKINIDKKAAELKEKIDRGETIGLRRRDWHVQGGNKDLNGNKNREAVHGAKRRCYDENNQSGTKFQKPKNRKPRKIPKALPQPENNQNLVPFAGIQSIEMDYGEADEDLNSNHDDLIEDDDLETLNADATIAVNVGDTPKVTPVVCGALSFLICEYGSSDEDIESTSNTYNKADTNNSCEKEERKESKSHSGNNKSINCQNIKSHKQNILHKKEGNLKEIDNPSCNGNLEQVNNNAASDVQNHSNKIPEQKIFQITNPATSISQLSEKESTPVLNEVNSKDDDGDSGPEEVKVDRNGQSANNDAPTCDSENKTNIVRKKVEVVRRKPVYRKPKTKLPSTLIYRLLSKEMKQERNKVLQCIRHIRKNNYFDKVTKSS